MPSRDVGRASLAELRAMEDRGEISRGAPRSQAELGGLAFDFWEKAELVSPLRVSVHLEVAPEVFGFFELDGNGRLTRMPWVVAAYARVEGLAVEDWSA